MKKMATLFKRDYETHLVHDEVTTGCEWVIEGEGIATEKFDGTACMIQDGKFYKRYDRKLTKSAHQRKRQYPDFVPGVDDFKPKPPVWIACEHKPDTNTGHWPGWIPVGDSREDERFWQAFDEQLLCEHG